MQPDRQDRRSFLGLCTAALLTMIGAVVATPVVGYVLGPLFKRGGQGAGNMVDLGSLLSIPVGTWQLVPMDLERRDGWAKVTQRHSVWVLRQGPEPQQVLVLSPICPHLGCPVNWDADHNQFKCPCHGGTFDGQGAYVVGPPPRSMDRLEYEVREGHLWVRWEDFKIGVAQRVPVEV